jgi:hypothetical protein
VLQGVVGEKRQHATAVLAAVVLWMLTCGKGQHVTVLVRVGCSCVLHSCQYMAHSCGIMR